MLTAANFTVNEIIQMNPNTISAASDITNGIGNADIANKLLALKSDVSMFKQGDPAAFLQTLVGEVGVDTKASLNFAESQEDIVRAVTSQRLSVAGVDIDEEGAFEIARRSRGTPRIANNLLRRVRDYAQVKAGNFITGEVACNSLSLLEIDPHGLDEMDRKVLETVCLKFSGGPVGLSTIAVSVGEEADTIEEAYEPFLIMEGYLERTPKGRVATPLAFKTLGLEEK
jgi:Holliday junction resolvasome RuvABC ATP-dependent DNA helicase subunit